MSRRTAAAGLVAAAAVALRDPRALLQAAARPAAAPPRVASFFSPPPPPAGLSAKAAFVLDASVRTPLFALNPDQRLAPASLTKIATALVVLARADLDEPVRIVEADLVDPGESQVGLVAGDTLSVRQLLVGLLVPSGNDAARALARFVGGRLDPTATAPEAAIAVFVDAMNARAAELGLENTRFANPTGIDAPDHYSSARDIATLTVAALADPLFAETIGTASATLDSAIRPDGYPVRTTNDLLVDGTVTGGKTGTTAEAGGCLVTTLRVGDNEILSVVLGSAATVDETGVLRSPARYDDTRIIIGALTTVYRWLDPLGSGAFGGLAEELSVWQSQLPQGPQVVVPVSREPELRYRLVLGPPAATGAEVGRVLFFVGPDLLSERAVVQS